MDIIPKKKQDWKRSKEAQQRMYENEQNPPKKSMIILRAVLIPCLAYLAWQAVNYIVPYAAIFLFSIYAVRNHSGANETELNELVYALFYRNISLLYILAALLLLLILYLVNRKVGFSRMIGINTRRLGGALSISSLAIGTFLGVSFNTLLNLISERLPESWVQENQESVSAFDGGSVLLSYMATVIAAPVVEELLFRGFLYNALKKILDTVPAHVTTVSHRLSVLTAALITSVLFGVYHGNILQGIYSGLLSLVMVWLYEITGTLVSNILFHAAFNFSGIATYLMVDAYGLTASVLISSVLALILMAATGIACRRRSRGGLNT